MKKEFDFSSVNLPYGILHDQKLTRVKRKENKMIFTFDIEIYPENYTNDFYKQYLPYKHCDMIVEMENEPFNYFEFVSAIKASGKFKGITFEESQFIDIINHASHITFIECAVSYGEFRIELCTGYYDAKRPYKKYNKYGICNINLNAKKVVWSWY